MSPPLLVVEGVVKRFGGLSAVAGASLDLRLGEIHALIGPNGAGKTTLVGLIAGSIRPDAGRVTLDGVDLGGLPMNRRAALGLARSFQVTSLFEQWTVRDNVALAVQARAGSSFRFWRPVAEEPALVEEAEAILAEIGLGSAAALRAAVLSHGDRRRLEIALALATRPRVLLLDEPLAGLGPAEAAELVSLIRSWRGRMSILLVEHDMDAVFQLSDRISVLVEGRVIASAEPAEIRADPAVQAAYLGEAA